MDQEHRPYESFLRLVGARLDREGTSGVRILELPDRITAIVAPGVDGILCAAVDFPYTALVEEARRRPLRARARIPLRRRFKGTYENLLRAIGYELEEAGAFTILIEELDAGMLITYQFYDPDSGFQLHKHRTMVSGEDLVRILHVAKSRRGRGSRQLRHSAAR